MDSAGAEEQQLQSAFAAGGANLHLTTDLSDAEGFIGQWAEISEQDKQSAETARREYQNKNFDACRTALESLKPTPSNDLILKHNLAVVDFLRGELSVDRVQSEINEVFQGLAERGGSEFEATDHLAVFFNLALTQFVRRKHRAALASLNRLLNHLKQPSSPQEYETILQKHVRPLLVSVLLYLQAPDEAIEHLNAIDKPPHGGEGATGSNMLARAHAYVLNRQHKAFKKDIKLADMKPDEQKTADFLRAGIEYYKGNLRKALKLLSNCNENDASSTPYMTVLSFNNLACIHLIIGKANLAQFEFQRALDHHRKMTYNLAESPSQLSADLLRVDTELVYNHSISLLHCGSHREAFQGFLRTLPQMSKNPHVWLHMAECCIAYYTQDEHDLRNLTRKNEKSGGLNKADERDALAANFKVLGNPAEKQKVVLTDKGSASGCPNLFNLDASKPRTPELSFSYASLCLQHAIYLLSRDEVNADGPHVLPTPAKTILFKAAMFVKSSYVALRLNDPTAAVCYAEELLHLPRASVPGGYVALAHLYCAEGLILQNKISDAITHLDVSTIQDVCFTSDKDEFNDAQHVKRSVSGVAHTSAHSYSLQVTKALFTFNVAVAHLNNGVIDKAETILDQVWANKGCQQFQSRVFMAMLYVQIKKGNMNKCQELIQKHCLRIL